MNRDTSVSAFNAEFAFENRNIRLSTNEGNTMMSWVNERGTKKASIKIDITPWTTDIAHTYEFAIKGIPVGTAVINHQLVLFTAEDAEIGNIYVFEASSEEGYDYIGKLIAHEKYNFDVNHPLETLVSYESDDVQKVYWTDYKNQLRFVNIAATPKTGYGYYTDKSFDFKLPASISSNPVKITKIFGSGEFPAGVIQYAFTYYNKYGQETNIFYVSPLQYISYKDRGGSPESKIANSFKIEITPVPYEHEYLRIYSILRTSLNATPLVKRVIDIKINGSNTIEYTDTGTNGDTIDPTELLYKSGNAVTSKTIEQKDNTLFLGGIKTIKSSIPKALRSLFKDKKIVKDGEDTSKETDSIVIKSKQVSFNGNVIASGDFKYINSIGISGYKHSEWYRVGIQFQDTLGEWSEPIWITDYQISAKPKVDYDKGELLIPQIEMSLPTDICTMASNNGYIYSRLLMAEPSANDRTIICQGIANPTLWQYSKRYKISKDGESIDTSQDGTLQGQPSWIFRPWYDGDDGIHSTTALDGGGYIATKTVKDVKSMDYAVIGPSYTSLQDSSTTDPSKIVISPGLNSIEIGCSLSKNDAFHINQDLVTVHSPELIFDETLYSKDWSDFKIRSVGRATFTATYGDIDIQTKTPTIGSAGGFKPRAIKTEGNAALVSGLYYEDFIVEEYYGDNDYISYRKYKSMIEPVVWPVYLWHHNGSLNNDCTRDNRSAELLKKKISNYHLATQFEYYDTPINYKSLDIKFFHSSELSMEKVNGQFYMGNIDTMVTPENSDFKYFSKWPFKSSPKADETIEKSILQPERCPFRLGTRKLATDKSSSDTDSSTRGLYAVTNALFKNFFTQDIKYENYEWRQLVSNIGDYVSDLDETSEGVRIKYKSTPHLVVDLHTVQETLDYPFFKYAGEAGLPIVEIYRDIDSNTLYGGKSEDALKANTWIPISEPFAIASNSSTTLTSMWGDTYYQTFECLKTYAFTQEDINQVVDIASFICETHVNIDGRYDRNRMQIDNLNMTPQNFNLLNPVYSQLNNFFSYKILDEDSYDRTDYSNVITWSLTKQSGADVDLWTSITLASTLELDGDKGAISKLVKLDNQLFAFQDSGLSQILYNEQTQISSTEGVPIEIANSGKVQGKRYYSNTIGCSNKHSITVTPTGIYFIDNNNKSIYLFNGQLNNLSTAGGFNAWAKQNIPSAVKEWTPVSFDNFVTYYDQLNQEVLFINDKEALAYSEKFNCFTSFYSYGHIPYFCNLDDMGIWITEDGLWNHQAGEYCNFFGDNKEFSMTLIGNQEPQADKIFTNLEFRACVEGEGSYNSDTDKVIPTTPFDSLEVWNEYQHGVLNLDNSNKKAMFIHGTKDGNSYLNRKFRIWRCDMPRDNAPVNDKVEIPMGIKRFKARPLDRIRNPWVYIQLRKKASSPGSYLSKTEVHDIVASYFG